MHEFYVQIDWKGQYLPRGKYCFWLYPTTEYHTLLVRWREMPAETKSNGLRAGQFEGVVLGRKSWCATQLGPDAYLVEDYPVNKLELEHRAAIELAYIKGMGEIRTGSPLNARYDFPCVNFTVRVTDPQPVFTAALQALKNAGIKCDGSIWVYIEDSFWPNSKGNMRYYIRLTPD